jgi:hypothetical protein
MKKVVIMVIAFLLLGMASYAAELPARSRLTINGQTAISETPKIDLRMHFIPAGNLSAGVLAPLGFVGLGFKPFKWLDLEPALGYYFPSNEEIINLRISPSWQKFYALTDFRWRPDSDAAYWFGQVEYKALKWLQIGLEEESWGNFDVDNITHGYGPNILFRDDKWGLDLAWHQRTYKKTLTVPETSGIEFFVRFHIYLKK